MMNRYGQGQGNRRSGGGGGGGGMWKNKGRNAGGSNFGGGRYSGRSDSSYYSQDSYGSSSYSGSGYNSVGYGDSMGGSSSMMSGYGGGNQVGHLQDQLRMQESQLAMTSNLLQQQSQLLAEVGMRVGYNDKFNRKRPAGRDYNYDPKRSRRDSSGPYGGYRSNDSRNMGRQRGRDYRGNDRNKPAMLRGKFSPPVADKLKATTHCHICDIETHTRRLFDVHLEEEKHVAKKQELEADAENEANKELLEKMKKIDELQEALTEECKLCDLSFSGSVREHERSDRHLFCKDQVEKGCGWCELAKFDDVSHILEHRNSREHIENMIKKGRKISGTRIEWRTNDEGKQFKLIIDDSVMEIDSSVTFCFACDEEMTTLTLMSEHQESDAHKEKLAALNEKAEEEETKTILEKVSKQDTLKEEQDQYCTVCDICYAGTEDNHIRETLHKYRGQQCARGCTWCSSPKLDTYTDVLRHRATEDHKEKEKEHSLKSGKDKPQTTVGTKKVDVPVFSKGKTYGEDEMMPILGYYCKACKKYYRKRYDTLKFHCSSENHYRNWRKVKETHTSSTAQFEEIQQAIVKTTGEELGETEPDEQMVEDPENAAEDNLQENGNEHKTEEGDANDESEEMEVMPEEVEPAEGALQDEDASAEETTPTKGRGTARRGKARRGRK